MAKFNNRDSLKISVINYDKFITSIEDEAFQRGRKRCDILIHCNTHKYFILGELKDRSPKGKVRSGAKKQLLSSLQTLIAVSEINAYAGLAGVKKCCYFNKQSTAPTTLNATTAFNRLSNVYPDGFQMNNPDMEALGFQFYEYTGLQTVSLTK